MGRLMRQLGCSPPPQADTAIRAGWVQTPPSPLGAGAVAGRGDVGVTRPRTDVHETE